MSAGRSASREAARIRARARRGVWGHVTAWAGRNPEAARADAVAGRWDRGADAERATARLLRPLYWRGWRIRHDRRLAGRRFNLDHVLVSPCGTAVVIVDTKRWHAQRVTQAPFGRLLCGAEDRHEEAEKAARYTAAVREALGMPDVAVWPVLAVHGSTVAAGGHFTVLTANGPVQVIAAGRLVGVLRSAPQGWSWRRTTMLAARVDERLPPYR